MTAKDKLIVEIMHLAYLVHVETPYCVFFSFSGHVEAFEISIRESKENWQNTVLDSQTRRFYDDARQMDGHNPALAELLAKRDVLKQILEEQEIPYDELDCEVEYVERYTF